MACFTGLFPLIVLMTGQVTSHLFAYVLSLHTFTYTVKISSNFLSSKAYNVRTVKV